jgi:SAM-dependent methyltransferase
MEKLIKVNMGSGRQLLDGFINVDLYDKEFTIGEGEYLKSDVRKIPLPDESVDYILASQVIEHLVLGDIFSTLQEWMRILKKGGRMVITAPDFNALCYEWLSSPFHPFNPVEYGYQAEAFYGTQANEGEVHRSPITHQLIQFLLSGLRVGKGKIHLVKKGDSMRKYPGYGEDGRVYRFGEIHIDIIKHMAKYSQFDEEEFLAEYFGKDFKKGKTAVEFGCHVDHKYSNCKALEESGWKCWFLSDEGEPLIHEFINVENVNGVFEKYKIPKDLDFLSIDIDGMDYWVWKELIWEPKLVCIEYNERRKEGIQPYKSDNKWSGHNDDFFGACKEEMIKLGKENGYKLVHQNQANLFFEKI